MGILPLPLNRIAFVINLVGGSKGGHMKCSDRSPGLSISLLFTQGKKLP